MPVVPLSELPPAGALLALDPGTKTLGVAVSDPTRLIASALETIRRAKLAQDAARVFDLYNERACTGLVVGLPLNMDGSEGPRAQSARALARNLLAVRDVPLAFADERLTTAGAERALLEADASRARRAEVIDAAAAAYLLQGVVDRLRNQIERDAP
jgi:putative Holliday junction resolvase